jgi:hypothetical protein
MTTLPGGDGFFSRAKCLVQMNKDTEDSEVDLDNNVHLVSDSGEDFNMDARFKLIKYCRKCELSCPIGK